MNQVLFKWLLFSSLALSNLSFKRQHPVFVSVTEIEHNAKDKTLEISCKIFTDDFEKTLRVAYKTHIDLTDAALKTTMSRFANDYIQKHLKINADGKPVALRFLGFEQIEEGIYSYFQADNINSIPHKFIITDDILFDYKNEQMNLIHATVNGVRKSTKLSYPEAIARLEF